MLALEAPSAGVRTVQRARPLLGTLVSIRARLSVEAFHSPNGLECVYQAMERAFGVVQDIERAMSAHTADSDLARLARSAPGDSLQLNAHTVAVLRLAKYWHQTSLGAFDPVRAANRLAALDQRPAFCGLALAPDVTLRELHIVDPCGVRVQRPMRLDLGGIAKGYAVDQAIAVLAQGGLDGALVNAGGDLRAFGAWAWPVEVRSPGAPKPMRRREQRGRLCNGAMATSVASPWNAEFIPSGRNRMDLGWTSCSVQAPDCVTADVLTKWGLQSPIRAPRLQRVLRAHGASLWRI